MQFIFQRPWLMFLSFVLMGIFRLIELHIVEISELGFSCDLVNLGAFLGAHEVLE